MYKYSFSFLALTETISLDIGSESIDTINLFAYKLLLIFGKVDYKSKKITLESFQQNSEEIRTKINEFVNEFNTQLPSINTVSAYFRKLSENEHFFFLHNQHLDTIDEHKLFNYLTAISEEKDYEKSQKQFEELFGELLNKYHVKTFGPRRVLIGEKVKSKRICRFCKNTKTPSEFKNKAHAIPEGLGNKTIILHEECDKCNDDFSKSIEPDIIQYLSIFRTFFDIKGKGGSKIFKGKNFEFKNEGNLELKFLNNDQITKESSIPFKIKLETNNPISQQNIYKSLCKFYLSVIDSKYLTNFSKTIDWINGNLEVHQLPKIGELISYHDFKKQPKILTYLRKDDNTDYPFAVGEFHFACKIIAFIVPLTEKDKTDYISDKDYEKFWNTFKHFKKTKGWIFIDLSNAERREFNINLKFENE